MAKTSRLDDDAPALPPRVYALPAPGDAVQRLVASAAGTGTQVFDALVHVLQAPLYLLYVLHTPHREGAPGRYQSPALPMDEVDAFLARHAAYLAADARFDLWAHSPSLSATVVWDRHDLVYAYGPLDAFGSRLQGLGFTSTPSLSLDAPHAHHYRAEFDADARSVLAAFDWTRSDLRPEDEQ